MSEWTKIKPTEPGWYWVKSKLFSKPHPLEIRIVGVDQLNYRHGIRVEFWDCKKQNWVLSGSSIELWQKVDNPPLEFPK